MPMKLSEKLYEKIKKQFPHIPLPKNDQIYRVHGLNDCFKWANLGVNESYIYSYETMKDCLNNEIEAEYMQPYHNSAGWIISIRNKQ